MESDSPNDFDVLTEIYKSLQKLSKTDQLRTLKSVATFLDLSLQDVHDSASFAGESTDRPASTGRSTTRSSFSEDRAISPKDFMRDKDPNTDLERVTCLAYYLTHFRDKPHFKTLDISTLNTEAAQAKLSNTSVSIENAVKKGLLVQAGKGNKQVSSAGELYVQQLPDRDSARASIRGKRHKRMPRKSQTKSPKSAKL